MPPDYPNRETLAFEAFKTYVKNNPEPAVGVQKIMAALEVKLDPTAASSASLCKGGTVRENKLLTDC